jgi:hypothetical protein
VQSSLPKFAPLLLITLLRDPLQEIKFATFPQQNSKHTFLKYITSFIVCTYSQPASESSSRLAGGKIKEWGFLSSKR